MASRNTGFTNTISALSKLEECLSCSICNRLMADPQIVTACEHCFCRVCILQVLSKNNHCPLCSFPIWKRDISPNYQLANVLHHMRLLQDIVSNPPSQEEPNAPKNVQFISNEKDGKTGNVPLKASKETSSVKRHLVSDKICEKNVKRLKTTQSKLDSYFDKQVSPLTVKQLHKRNHKGEMPLHIAAIKGKVKDVDNLLRQGADPNAKDNAGWTPLHEACNHGHVDIVEALVRHGAMVDVPGYDNNTPLHDAVNNGHCQVVSVLVSHGASTSVRVSPPRDITTDCKIKAALSREPTVAPLQYRVAPSLPITKVILSTGLRSHQKKQLKDLVGSLGCKVVDHFTKEITHVVTNADTSQCCARTFKCLLAVSCGAWLVSYNWITNSLTNGLWLDETEYEVKGFLINQQPIVTNAPCKSRRNNIEKAPGLFNNCQFYFTDHLQMLTKQEFSQLITSSDGIVLMREPRPLTENSTPDRCHPWHAKSEFFTKCNVFVVNDEAMPCLCHNIVTLHSPWILKCLSYFELFTVEI